MDDYRSKFGKNHKAEFYNPDDISNFIERQPIEVLRPLATSLMECAIEIEMVANVIYKHPDIDTIATFDTKYGKLKELMESILYQTYLLERIIRTTVAYRKAYDKGEIKSKDSDE